MALPVSTGLRVPLKLYLTSDHVTPATGKTVAVVISKNMGAFANPSAGATNATEVSNGWYYVDLSTTDTNTTGPIVVRGTATACDDAEWVDTIAAATVADVNVTKWAGATTTTGDIAIKTTLAKTTHITGFNDIAATAIVSSGAITTSGGAVTTVTNLTTNNDKTGYSLSQAFPTGFSTLTTATIAAKVWDEVLTGTTHNIQNSAGKTLRSLSPNASGATLRSGTAQAGTSSTITLDTGASAVDDTYRNTIISITGGTGSGQSAIIASYVGATKVATITGTWATPPDSTSTFDIDPMGQVIVAQNNDKTGYSLTQTFPANFASLSINASGHISRVVLVDTTTTNTDMRGTDNAALASTALSNATWTSTRAGYLDNLSGGAVALAATALSNATWTDIKAGYLDAAISTAGGSGLDAAGVRAAVGLASANLDTQLGTLSTFDPATDTVARVTLVDTATSVSLDTHATAYLYGDLSVDASGNWTYFDPGTTTARVKFSRVASPGGRTVTLY